MSGDLLDRLAPHHYPTIARLILDTPTAAWVESGDGSPSDNATAYSRYRLLPRVLTGPSDVRSATTLLGAEVSAPIGIAPIGLQGALHPDGEIAMATGAARAGSVMIVPVNSTTPIPDIAAAAPDAVLWFQLYNWQDRDALAAVVAEAVKAGVRAIVPLVNTPLPVAHTPASIGFRLPAGKSLAHGAGKHDLDATIDWAWLRWLVSTSGVPVVPKGIMHPDDARQAIDAGCPAVLISNHGGRQVSRSIATLTALGPVARAVGDRAEVYLDGGIRSGTDALIALALGARAVFLGRLACWGLAVGGADGVARTLDSVHAELVAEAGMCGVTDLSALPDDLVAAAGT
jgi:4-hydroxymandelate oxidase